MALFRSMAVVPYRPFLGEVHDSQRVVETCCPLAFGALVGGLPQFVAIC